MFERFTDRARGTVVTAQEEARRLHHDYIGTEHILLGLLREQEGVAAEALRALGVGLEDIRQEVTEIVGQGQKTPKGHIPFTSRAKKVLELSLREALQLKHDYIGTEHILLGLAREGEGVAAQVLVKLGADLFRVRQQVIALLNETPEESGEHSPTAQIRRTRAAEQIIASAEELAGGSPLGSHHLLEALARTEGSAAAKVFEALEVDEDVLAAKIDEVGIEGTTDLTDEEAAARQMELRLEDGELKIIVRDEAAIELAQAVTEHVGGPIRGDDPVAGGLTHLHQAVSQLLTDLHRRVAPAPEEDPETEGGTQTSLIQRAIRNRLRRRAW